MDVIKYYIYFVLILGVATNYRINKDKGLESNEHKKNNKRFVIVSMFMLFLISALRSEYCSVDTPGYGISFRRNLTLSYDEIIDNLSVEGAKDPVYVFFAWAFGQWFPDFQQWLGFISALFCGAVGYFIYKNSKIPMISIVMLVALGFVSFAWTGLRQAISIAIIIFSYKYIKERKLIKFVICVLIASLFHQTGLIFLIAYPLSKLKFGIKTVLITFAAIISFLFLENTILDIMSFFLEDEQRYGGYLANDGTNVNSNAFIIQLFIFMYSLFYYKKAVQNDKNNLILYNLSFIGIILQLMQIKIVAFNRLAMYFSIFNIALVPNASMCEDDSRNRSLFQVLVILVLILYLFYFNNDMFYWFYWEAWG